jgi:mono/diheme cytochrome c family protein
MARHLALALCALFAACGPSAPTWKQDVGPLVAGRCVNCHVAGGIAPFPLTRYADAKPHALAMAAATQRRSMPPWNSGDGSLPLLHDPRLTDAQIQLLTDWANAGAPEGSGPDATPLEQVGSAIGRVDLELAMPEPYTPQLSPDEYRCFVIDWPKNADTFVTGFNALPGVSQQVHHLAVYAVPPAEAHYPKEWDAQEAGPGYTCWGGPFGDHPSTFPVNLLTAWIPGTQGTSYPRPFGIKVEPGTTLVLQMHYNTENSAPVPDLTRLQFKLDDTVEKVGAYQPFLDETWALGAMPIPAGQERVVHQYAADPRTFFGLLGSPLNTDNGFNIEAVMFHMHQLGASGGLWLQKADGTKVQILDIPRWDFHWQQEYFLKDPVRFEPGDKLIVRCIFDNTQGRWPAGQVPKDVNWGEGSEDEMCVANLLSSE